MASKTVRRTTVTASSSRSTPQPSTSNAGRPSSPLSPTKITRLQEKEEMQNLNDRLAAYIEKVRNLEHENSKLVKQVTTFEETREREISNTKSMYENELRDARKIVDEISKEKARMEIDCKKLLEENEALRKDFDRKSKDLDNLQRSFKVLEDRYGDLNAKYESAIKDKKRLENENAELARENKKLKKELEDTRKHLEEETLHRVDLENTLQSTKEENNFRQQLLQEELTKTRSRRQIEITEIDGQLKEQYDAKLQESLRELRDEFEATIIDNRENLEKMYEDKIRALTEQANRNAESAANAFEEMRLTKLRTDNYSLKNKELEAIIADLNKKINNLENDIERERERFSNERRNFEDSVNKLREEMNRMMADYQDLMDVKIALDVEISAYRKLLESEETRLNLSAQATPARRSIARSLTPSRQGTPSRKRARTQIDESEESSSLSHHTESASAKGDVEISSVCPDGKFVKIFNKGDKDVSIGGWHLTRKVGDQETTFKFYRSAKIEPGSTVTVWSANSGQTHEAPLNLVMKGQRWFVGDVMSTTLTNAAGEEMAVRDRQRVQTSSQVVRQRESFGGHSFFSRESVGREDLYHQRGDPQDEKCRLM